METTTTTKTFQIQSAVKSIKQLPPKIAVSRKITHEKRWKNCRSLLNNCEEVHDDDNIVVDDLQENGRNNLCDVVVDDLQENGRNNLCDVVVDDLQENGRNNLCDDVVGVVDDTKKCIYTEVKKNKNKTKQQIKQPAVNPDITSKQSQTTTMKEELQVVCSLGLLFSSGGGVDVFGLSGIQKLMLSQLNRKLQGYKMQDVRKKLYLEHKIITLLQIVELLCACELKCCYCPDTVLLLYNNVREPKQWSLDRIDNHQGHNADNVCVSCLSCNLKRKTTFHQLFLKSKKMVFNITGRTAE